MDYINLKINEFDDLITGRTDILFSDDSDCDDTIMTKYKARRLKLDLLLLRKRIRSINKCIYNYNGDNLHDIEMACKSLMHIIVYLRNIQLREVIP